MKTLIPTLLLFLLLGNYSEAQDADIKWKGIPCQDSSWYLSTEYPVRLTNNIKDLQKTISELVILYPEDKTISDLYIYFIRVDCDGKALDARLWRSTGSNKLRGRLEKVLLSECTWIPAIHMDMRVGAYYEMKIIVEKGKCKIIEIKAPNHPTI